MRYRAWTSMAAAVAGICASAAPTRAEALYSPLRLSPSPAVHSSIPPAPDSFDPTSSAPLAPLVKPLMLAEEPESIYAQPMPKQVWEGVNEGGVNFDITVNYLTDYVFRGIDRSEVGGAEDAPNLQFLGELTFNLGRLPHPFVGAFVNVYNDDPVSRFQEVRPYFGLEWDVKPVTISIGHANYIFPERDDLNTAEVYGRFTLDDSFLWHTDHPVLSPYVFAAYDYDLYKGAYFEAGIQHDIPIEDTGVVVTFVGDIGYSLGDGLFTPLGGVEDTGFQHYDIGLIGTYSLNTLFNFPRRYGEWKLKGYFFYTDGIDKELRADSQLWGGMGIQFQY